MPTDRLPARLRGLARRQGEVFTRRQALTAGLGADELRSLLAPRGPLVAVRRGVYAERELWESLDPNVGRPRLGDRAAHLAVGVPHAMSHDSAARLLGVESLWLRPVLAHIVRSGVGGSRTEHGIKHHLARARGPSWTEVDGIPVTGLARTVLDLAREHGYLTGLTAADWALHQGLDRGDLEAELELMRSWPQVTVARRVADNGDGGAESPAETLGRDLVVEAGIGPVETQFPVRLANGSVAWCDLRVGRHLIECDGRVKYQPMAAGGVAERPVTEVLWAEKDRQRLVCAEGLGMSRLIWSDYFHGRRQAIAMLRREYQVTRDRFGDRLPPEMAGFAAELRGRFGNRRPA